MRKRIYIIRLGLNFTFRFRNDAPLMQIARNQNLGLRKEKKRKERHKKKLKERMKKIVKRRDPGPDLAFY